MKKILISIIVFIIATSILIFVKTKLAKENIDVYFAKFESGSEKVIPVKRQVKTCCKINQALMILIQGPSEEEKEQGLYTEIPSNTAILSVEEEKDEVIINLSSEFEFGGGAGSMSTRVYQLEKTLEGLTSKPIYLQLDGEKRDSIGGEGIIIQQPICNECRLTDE